MKRPPLRARGLSLIEVMIAMVLMALVGIMAERGLSQMVRARDTVAAEQQRWRNIAFALARFGEDVSFSADGVPEEPALVQWRGSGSTLRWARWGQDGQVMRLAYTLNGGQLQRHISPAVDSPSSTEKAPASSPPIVLLEHVANLRVGFLDSHGSWHDAWPAEGSDETRPRAVSLALTLDEGVQLQRLVALP